MRHSNAGSKSARKRSSSLGVAGCAHGLAATRRRAFLPHVLALLAADSPWDVPQADWPRQPRLRRVRRL